MLSPAFLFGNYVIRVMSISVSGRGEAIGVPDLVTMRLGVEACETTVQAAISAMVWPSRVVRKFNHICSHLPGLATPLACGGK